MATVPARALPCTSVREVRGRGARRGGRRAGRRWASSPTITLARFEYVTLGLALLGAFGGRLPARRRAARPGPARRRRGRWSAALLLAVTLAYAELLRRYGTPGLVAALLDGVHWSRDHLRRVPAPDRDACSASRRWRGAATCAPGAGRAGGCARSVSPPPPRSRTALLEPAVSRPRAASSVVYGVRGRPACSASCVIRADLRLTGPRGRAGRRAEEAAAVRARAGPRPAALL